MSIRREFKYHALTDLPSYRKYCREGVADISKWGYTELLAAVHDLAVRVSKSGCTDKRQQHEFHRELAALCAEIASYQGLRVEHASILNNLTALVSRALNHLETARQMNIDSSW